MTAKGSEAIKLRKHEETCWSLYMTHNASVSRNAAGHVTSSQFSEELLIRFLVLGSVQAMRSSKFDA